MKIRNLLITTALAIALFPDVTTAEKLTLLLTKRCPNCLLSWVKFSHVDLSGADLRNSNLRGARFVNVNLTDADLSGADLRHAYLEGVSMQNTNLCGAIMMNGQKSPIGCWAK
ncbi:MAG: pentapeptide repeat-containing protein [Leptolyngbya sp. SIO1D8]|nr:pentapeptide repeat-containing protein [Leptolyngbya sp. SIO1D8]